MVYYRWEHKYQYNGDMECKNLKVYYCSKIFFYIIPQHNEHSSRPPTQHFLISHNISEPWNTTTVNSSIILTGIKRGNTYVIFVSAFNILGESLPKDINGINNNVSLINVTILFSTVHINNTDETTVTTHTGLVY